MLSAYLLLKQRKVNYMPRLDIDMFDKAPKVGDKIKVLGKVDSINEDSGEVEVTYDDVSIVKKSSKKSDDNDSSDDTVTVDMESNPNTQSLDYALSQSFDSTQ